MIKDAFNTPLEKRLGICICKLWFLHRPDDYIGFMPICLPKFSNKSPPMAVFYYCILLCLFVSKYDINGNGLNYNSAVSSNKIKYIILKSSARIKQSVIGVALETPPVIRLGICMYKTSLLHWRDNYIGFMPSCSPKFYNKIGAMALLCVDWKTSSFNRCTFYCIRRMERCVDNSLGMTTVSTNNPH